MAGLLTFMIQFPVQSLPDGFSRFLFFFISVICLFTFENSSSREQRTVLLALDLFCYTYALDFFHFVFTSHISTFKNKLNDFRMFEIIQFIP